MHQPFLQASHQLPALAPARCVGLLPCGCQAHREGTFSGAEEGGGVTQAHGPKMCCAVKLNALLETLLFWATPLPEGTGETGHQEVLAVTPHVSAGNVYTGMCF